MTLPTSAGAPKAGAAVSATQTGGGGRFHTLIRVVGDRPWTLIYIIIGLGTILRLPQLNNSLNEFHAFRQTQTAFTAREFAERGFDILGSPLPLFGPNADVPMEMPLFQALVALVSRTGLSIDESGRLVSLVFFQISAVLLTMLVMRYSRPLAAIVTATLYQFVPFTVQWGAAHLMEFTAVALALGMVLGLDSWLRHRSYIGLGAGIVLGVLAFLVKSTTAPVWCLFLIVPGVLALRELGWNRGAVRASIGAAAILPGLVSAILWTRHADQVKEDQPLTGFLTSEALSEWNFGTVEQRLDPDAWGTLVTRTSETMTGPFLIVLALVAIGAVRIATPRERAAIAGLLGVVLGGPLVFFNLYWQHTYYLSAIAPALIALTGMGIAWTAGALTASRGARGVLAVLGSLIVLMATWLTPASADIARGVVTSESDPPLALELAAVTGDDDLVVTVGCDWTPEILYYAERRGVMFRADADSDSFWDVNDIADYPYVLTCNPEVDPSIYLPAGVELERESPSMWRTIPNT